MRLHQDAEEALGKYGIDGDVKIVQQLEATHAVFQVRAGKELSVLRQFNPYMRADDLRTQFLLAELMREGGLQISTPRAAADGEAFVEVGGRLWALFPWCEGRPGRGDCLEDLGVLAGLQGSWVASGERLRSNPHWSTVVSRAESFRQRKSWAWAVPLDRVGRFARQHKIIERGRAEVREGPHHATYLDLLTQVDTSVREFEGLLRQKRTQELPHTVTHGDFSVNNIRIWDDRSAVLDLDCFSFEPRTTDFARTANWCYGTVSGAEKARLLERFQLEARLSTDEVEALPLMMCAHDLYYAVGHVLLFLSEDDPEEQRHLLTSIEKETKAPHRYRLERDSILGEFLRGA